MVEEKAKKIFKMPVFWRRFLFTVIIVAVIFGLGFSGLVAYSYYYADRVLPGINIGSIPVGGMDREELRNFINKMNDKMVAEGIKFKYAKDNQSFEFVVSPVSGVDSGAVELVRFNLDEEIDKIINYNKAGNFFIKNVRALPTYFSASSLKLTTVEIDRDRLISIIKEKVYGSETIPHNANVEVLSISPLDYKITSSTSGILYDYISAVEMIAKDWSVLENKVIEIKSNFVESSIQETDVEKIINRLPIVFTVGSLTLNYIDPYTSGEYSWVIDVEKIQKWIEVQKTVDNELGFGLRQEYVDSYIINNIKPKVNREAKDAKFVYDETIGKVTEFQGSSVGIELDLAENYRQINEAILGRTWHDEGLVKSVSLTIKKIEPKIKTGDVNDLGINELLGVGVSDYSGSPNNRMKNIKNAMKKLNGILVKPGEEFSTLDNTKPFTLEGGYFPELVIKGDEVKPEIGGGLCQIGTTLFRMAMNSAMEITQRRNHSLVVFHYNDPVNKLPGTDATVYDPAPDFRFKNDTSGYILVQTFMDTSREELVFSLWGTNDGRKGSYTHPVVSKWIPSGEPKNIETTNLEPGKKQCQNAFKGADASFIYTRILASGDKQDKLFESHYRPLPKICLVGVEAVVTSTVENIVPGDTTEVPVVPVEPVVVTE
ncbi:MAG TPA: hypothetical protein DEB09_01945 [Candidatus Magasanikbacteria bacterium]|nr:hypothetical protein [Candidatus Magasanikbacteria bacterium]